MAKRKNKALLKWLIEGEFALTLPRLVAAIILFMIITVLYKFGALIQGGEYESSTGMMIFKIGLSYLLACQVYPSPDDNEDE